MAETGNENLQTPGEPTTTPENAPASDYVADAHFEDLGLSEAVLRGVHDRGYKNPTPVQARAIPRAIAGKDLIVRSKTGTGKTAAFGLPILERLDPADQKPRAIILCPTRELALQVAEELSALGRPKGIQVAAIYGGAPMKQQTDALEAGAQVIVGTPGRVYDHLRRKTLDLSGAMFGVLDEADEMLNQGFYEEVTRILEKLPDSRQMLLFSATVPPDIDRLIRRFCRDPETLLLSGDEFTVEGIENVLYYTVDAYPKPRNLIYLLEIEEPDAAIVFCNTRDDTSLINAVLNRNGFDAEVLNGDLPQKERERVMAKVKRGELSYLVATDIAARGIDISDLSHVINYSLPEDPAVYLHRVGRTGRIGKKGVALSLVGGREMVTLTALEKRYGIKFEERKLPTPEAARKRWTDRHVLELREAAKSVVTDPMVPLAQDLRTTPDGDNLVAFLLRYFFTHHRVEKVAQQVLEPEAAPRSVGRGRDRDRDRDRPRERRERRDEPRRERAAGSERAPKAAAPAASAEPGTPTVATEAGTSASNAAPTPPVAPAGGPEAEAAEAAAAAAELARGSRLFCNLGSADNLDENAIAETLAQLAGVERARVREVERRPAHSFVYVEPASADAFLQLNGREREGKKLRIELSRSRRGRS